jgi:simple sugar transport system permease protein
MDRLLRRSEFLVAVTIIALSLIIGLRNPTFFSIGYLFDLLRSSIVIGIFAMGVLIVLVSGASTCRSWPLASSRSIRPSS